MTTNPHTQAVLLLTAHLPKAGRDGLRPLSPGEWGRFALWLKDRSLQPEALLTEDPETLLAGWLERTVTPDRIRALLGRAGALALALERWQRAGLWVLTRADVEYPDRLIKRLKAHSPPALFGCGDRSLLQRGGLAVVGSRDATGDDLAFTTQLAAKAAAQGFSVVSGGARGVDEAAMLGALEQEGTVVGALADSLLRCTTSARYRKGLMSNRLALISSFHPEAGFNAGNAMARNKYIYCLADAAVVVSSSEDSIGTWNGAIENLKRGWVPLWVKPPSEGSAGNAELVRRGASWLPEGDIGLASLLVSGQTEPQ